ncbi:MAG TPA: alpha-(1-_3)-arabinofuranosyltransferase family protein, partial [Acidimicrobiia bacterium]
MPGEQGLYRRVADRGRARWWTFALVAYVPLLLTDRGKVASDTKSYLYLDPSRLLASATSMWDPHVGLGTVSHQNIGYLFPMGPFYWVTEQMLHVPSWIAQRLWLGTLLFA